MKILLIHNEYQKKGGEDFVVNSEAELLRSYGHEVELLLFNNDEVSSSLDKVKAGIGLFYNRSSAKKVSQAIQRFSPDVIHVHNIFYLISPAVFYMAQKHKVPVVMTFHNYRLICPGAMLMRDAKVCELCVDKVFPIHGIKYGCHRDSKVQTAQLTLMTGIHKVLHTWRDKIDRYIVLTDFVKEKVTSSSLKLAPEKVIVKPNFAVDLGVSPPEAREDFFLYIGRLSDEKGVRVLLESTKYHDYKLEIIGDGPLRGMVESYMKDNPNITWWGFRDKAFISDRLAKCLAMVFTSVCYEGMPLTILEAFSKGTPVIASDIDNINRIVLNKHNGLHFATAKPRPLAEQISFFSRKKDELVDLYHNARQDYENNYSPEANYQQLLGVYQSMVAQKQAPSIV